MVAFNVLEVLQASEFLGVFEVSNFLGAFEVPYTHHYSPLLIISRGF